MLLHARDLTVRYGRRTALSDFALQLEPGEVRALIGPNGAGKSTVFELLTGFHSADAGRVRFQGRPILGLRPDQINRLGMGRTFQKLKPFQRMTVEENVMVGGLQHDADLGAAREQALTALYFVGLLDKRNADAGTLSTGQRKRLELARAMATGPKLLLLDEVTGGVDQRSIPALTELVGRLRSQGTTLIVIEHNMQVLMSLADRILALHLGRKIAVGTPREIQEDTLVIESYLGAAYA